MTNPEEWNASVTHNKNPHINPSGAPAVIRN
jgi:hypothetical protein